MTPGEPLRDVPLYGANRAALPAEQFTDAITGASGIVVADEEAYVAAFTDCCEPTDPTLTWDTDASRRGTQARVTARAPVAGLGLLLAGTLLWPSPPPCTRWRAAMPARMPGSSRC
jgi:hypothetical protein